MKNFIITHTNADTGEFFFSTDHCQKHNLGDRWVPCTYGPLPGHVSPRPSLPTGVINNKEDYLKVFGVNNKQILNPQPEYQA